MRINLPKTINTFGIWTQYTNFRFKEPHDILLCDGKIILNAYPNGGGWSLRGDDKDSEERFYSFCKEHECHYIDDSYVVAIRLLTDQDIVERELEWFTGKERMERITSFHAEGREHVIIPKNALVKDDVIREFVNTVRTIAVKYGATQQLREHVSKHTRKTFKSVFYSENKE